MASRPFSPFEPAEQLRLRPLDDLIKEFLRMRAEINRLNYSLSDTRIKYLKAIKDRAEIHSRLRSATSYPQTSSSIHPSPLTIHSSTTPAGKP